jgi:glucose-6-phosphate isomerase
VVRHVWPSFSFLVWVVSTSGGTREPRQQFALAPSGVS